MKQLEAPPEADDSFDIGALVGERRTLGKLAGGCSAADAQCLRKIRESKQYLSKAKTWEEFCPKYLGIDRSTADRLIRHLEEFGAEAFATMQLLGLTPKQYRLLAPRVQGNALCLGGETVALVPENGEQIHAALREMREKAAEPKATPERDRLQELEKRGSEIAGEYRSLCRLGPGEADRRRIAEMLHSLTVALARVKIEERL